jgi:hypothetical protein
MSSRPNTTIVSGDFAALTKALKAAGIVDADIAELKTATEQDAIEQQPGLGKKTGSWLANLGAKMGGASWQIGTAAGIEIVKEMVMKYLGG